MPKRSMEENINENLRSNFEYDNSDIILKKKFKLEHEKTISKIKETNKEEDISEHEVYKFLLIFHTLF